MKIIYLLTTICLTLAPLNLKAVELDSKNVNCKGVLHYMTVGDTDEKVSFKDISINETMTMRYNKVLNKFLLQKLLTWSNLNASLDLFMTFSAGSKKQFVFKSTLSQNDKIIAYDGGGYLAGNDENDVVSLYTNSVPYLEIRKYMEDNRNHFVNYDEAAKKLYPDMSIIINSIDLTCSILK